MGRGVEWVRTVKLVELNGAGVVVVHRRHRLAEFGLGERVAEVPRQC